MPQRRKVPFSGKKKKEQLLQKRQRKNKLGLPQSESQDSDEGTKNNEIGLQSVLVQARPTRNRFDLQFNKETKEQLDQARQDGFTKFTVASPEDLEVGAKYFDNYDFPIRPNWSYDMKKETLDHNENKYFREYIIPLLKRHQEENEELSVFELNLETWRQLWRVLEFSDILLIIVDVRFASLMFPPSIYNYITKTLKKHAILILNKIDLASPEAIVAWRHYFKNTYPGLPIIHFASYSSKKFKGTAKGRREYKRSIEGVYNIYCECQKIVDSQVDLSKWEQKILKDMELDDSDFDMKSPPMFDYTKEFDTYSQNGSAKSMFHGGKLTIGCIGFPNVGKSSLINSLNGRKVVSVSRTPGHTKHFQTIFITSEVRLCDCPGLVFPSSTPKYIQVLLGSYSIAQLRVPYPTLKFLGSHLNLPQLLKLELPPDSEFWSAVTICDAWALKRGFLTAKAGRPDRYRAANHLLRMCLAGQIILQFYPPGFEKTKDLWMANPEVNEVKKYLNIEDGNDEKEGLPSFNNSEESESDEIDSSNSDEEDEYEHEASSSPRASRNAFALLEDN